MTRPSGLHTTTHQDPPTDGGKARVPTLNLGEQEAESATTATSNKEKSNTFIKTFFSAPRTEEQIDVNEEYPPPKFSFSTITNTQVRQAIT